MGIGAYRHYVTLSHPAGPITAPGWWCAIQSSGAQVLDGQMSLMLRGRYHGGLQLDTQIAFEGRTLQVMSVGDVDERHTEMIVQAVEVVARGRNPEN